MSRPTRTVTLVLSLALGCLVLMPSGVLAQPEIREVRGHCTLSGTSGRDLLIGTPGDDVICGRGGNDEIIARRGADLVYGGTGDDTLIGGSGRDHLLGQRGADYLQGSGGQDLQSGGKSNDCLTSIDGFAGDVLRGGDGPQDHYLAERGDRVRAAEISGQCPR